MFFSAFGVQTNKKFFGILKIFVSWHAKHETMYIVEMECTLVAAEGQNCYNLNASSSPKIEFFGAYSTHKILFSK